MTMTESCGHIRGHLFLEYLCSKGHTEEARKIIKRLEERKYNQDDVRLFDRFIEDYSEEYRNRYENGEWKKQYAYLIDGMLQKGIRTVEDMFSEYLQYPFIYKGM